MTFLFFIYLFILFIYLFIFFFWSQLLGSTLVFSLFVLSLSTLPCVQDISESICARALIFGRLIEPEK